MIKWLIKIKKVKSNKLEHIYKVIDCVADDTNNEKFKTYKEINELIGLKINKLFKKDIPIYINGNDFKRLDFDDIHYGVNLDDKNVESTIKQSIITKKIDIIFDSKLNIFNMFKYMSLLSKFGEHGIFINDKNREEQYIEIITRDNPELLNYLQEYLDLKEFVDGSFLELNEYMKYINE